MTEREPVSYFLHFSCNPTLVPFRWTEFQSACSLFQLTPVLVWDSVAAAAASAANIPLSEKEKKQDAEPSSSSCSSFGEKGTTGSSFALVHFLRGGSDEDPSLQSNSEAIACGDFDKRLRAAAGRCVLLKAAYVCFAASLETNDDTAPQDHAATEDDTGAQQQRPTKRVGGGTIEEIVEQLQTLTAEASSLIPPPPSSVLPLAAAAAPGDDSEGGATSAAAAAVVSMSRFVSCAAPLAAQWAAIALSPSVSFRYQVEAMEQTIKDSERRRVIHQFGAVGHAGAVTMQNPDIEFSVFLLYEHRAPQASTARLSPPAAPLRHILHGVVCARGGRAELLDRYSLKKRLYIGTTSMVPELTFLMTNVAQVQRNDLVYDPFCGTGSSLVSAAHWGAKVMGTDMDGRVLRSGSTPSAQQRQQIALAWAATEADWAARRYTAPLSPEEAATLLTEEERSQPSMKTNFVVYRLPTTPERMRLNFSTWRATLRRRPLSSSSSAAQFREGWLDAILSDPPYGVREQKRRRKEPSHNNNNAVAAEGATPTTAVMTSTTAAAVDSLSPSTGGAAHRKGDDYAVCDLLTDLFSFAANALVVGGRLVFWLPTTIYYTPAELPTHPCLVVESDLGQQVTLKMVRRLITVRKHRPLYEWTKAGGGSWALAPGIAQEDAAKPLVDGQDLREHIFAEPNPEANSAYDHYKSKIQRKRDAVRTYWKEGTNETEAKEGVNSASPPDNALRSQQRPKRPMGQPHTVQTAEVVIANRAKKLEEQQRHHQENNERQRQENERRRLEKQQQQVTASAAVTEEESH